MAWLDQRSLTTGLFYTRQRTRLELGPALAYGAALTARALSIRQGTFVRSMEYS